MAEMSSQENHEISTRPDLNASSKSTISYEPLFINGEITPGNSKTKAVFSEWLSAMNVLESPKRLSVGNFAFQLLTFLPFISFVSLHISLGSSLFFMACIVFLGTVYNTVWYHRYCSHHSFTFKKPIYARAFLWSNPLSLIFREEVYAIPHRKHHQRTEKPGDPYGPHLGWFRTFLAPEITQRLDTNLTEKDFNLLRASVNHICLGLSTFNRFQNVGSLEDLSSYIGRVLCAQVGWAATVLLFGGVSYLMAWYAAIFAITCLIRDFNWRGHGGSFPRTKKKNWEFDSKSHALNQRFYGYLASEWHDNHHRYPFSASNGFLPGQIDIAFYLIKLMHRLGIVESYVDARTVFQKECLSIETAR